MANFDSLLISLQADDSDEAVTEKLVEIKKHLINTANDSKNVLKSSEFFKNAIRS